ncbi:MAG: VOC family protein [Bacteroidota bacterium]
MNRESNSIHPFHLAIPVYDLQKCRAFYSQVLQCKEGRSSDKWVDFDFFGHQLVIHQVQSKTDIERNPVDGHDVPIPHFGVVLDWDDWQGLAEHLKSQNVQFVIEPYIRFEGQVGEQATLFFLDPDGNALEFKAFRNSDQLFAKV